MGQADLSKIVSKLTIKSDKNVLASFDHFEDAGVYQLSSELAIVQSVDVITPVVDDPFIYGQIAAANALSDIYAKGAKPLTALNIAGIPICDFDDDLLIEIQRGGINKLEEAGCTLIGGHTLNDKELKYGLCITGTIHPDKVCYNNKARVGDEIIITKPIGNGIITTAYKADMAAADHFHKSVSNMVTLNKTASEIMLKYSVSACTDVTGFGLLGHLWEVASSSNVTATLHCDSIPILSGVYEYARMGLIPSGAHNNEKFLQSQLSFEKSIDKTLTSILCDPQTSGGLLICVNKKDAKNLLKELKDSGIMNANIIGSVMKKGERAVVIGE